MAPEIDDDMMADAEEIAASNIEDSDDIEAVQALNVAYEKLTEQIGRAIVGQKEVIEQVLVAATARCTRRRRLEPEWLRTRGVQPTSSAIRASAPIRPRRVPG